MTSILICDACTQPITADDRWSLDMSAPTKLALSGAAPRYGHYDLHGACFAALFAAPLATIAENKKP